MTTPLRISLRRHSSSSAVGRLRVQLVSDVHLERHPDLSFEQVVEPRAEVLCLAGDIGRPSDDAYYRFLHSCSQSFQHTVLVAGNHEYRRSHPLTMREVDARLHEMCRSLPNASYLAHGENIVLGEVNFIGATMWTPLRDDLFPAEQLRALQESLSRQRVNSSTPWGVEQNNLTHEAHRRAIEEKVRWGAESGKRNVVITHHAPLLSGPFEKPDLPGDYLYGTDLSTTIAASPIAAWFFGHTHWNFAGRVHGTQVVSNQYGTGGIQGWSRSCVVHV